MLTWTVKYVHLFTMTIWFGGMIFFSYVAAPAAFKVLQRQAAGDFVGAVFPKYFLLGYIASICLLVTLYIMGRNNILLVRTPLIILSVITCLTFVQGMVVGTKARAIKTEYRAMAEGPEKQLLKKAFGKIHAVSAIMNLVVVLLSLVYIGYIPMILRL